MGGWGDTFILDLPDQLPNLVFIVMTLWKNITRVAKSL
jgi:hypothetical protein